SHQDHPQPDRGRVRAWAAGAERKAIVGVLDALFAAQGDEPSSTRGAVLVHLKAHVKAARGLDLTDGEADQLYTELTSPTVGTAVRRVQHRGPRSRGRIRLPH